MRTTKGIFVQTIVMLAVAGLTIGACSKNEKSSDRAGAKNGSELAKVGNVSITQTDLDNELEMLPPQWRGRAQTEGGKRNILQNIIRRKLILQEAVVRNLDRDPKLLVELERMKTARLLNKMLESDKAEEEILLRQRFEENKTSFSIPPRVHAQHILLKVQPDASKAQSEKVQRRAQDIAKQARSGADFTALAKKYSEGPTREKGGDLGTFPRGKMDPTFENAVFNMKKSEISNPVRTPFGFHIIKLVDRVEGKVPSYEEVKEQVEKRFRAQIQREKYEKFLGSLETKYPVQFNDAALQDAPAPAAPKAAAPVPAPAAKPAPAAAE